MHVLGPCRAQRPGALVGGRPRRVDVVDESDGPRRGARRERAAHVAPAGAGIEPALGADGARAPHERQDRDAPPAGELLRELGRRVGAAQQQPVALRREPRRSPRPRAAGSRAPPGRRPAGAGRDLAALPARRRAAAPGPPARAAERARGRASAAAHRRGRLAGRAPWAPRSGRRAAARAPADGARRRRTSTPRGRGRRRSDEAARAG